MVVFHNELIVIDLILYDLAQAKKDVEVARTNTSAHLGDVLLSIAKAEKKVKDLGSGIGEVIAQVTEVKEEALQKKFVKSDVEDLFDEIINRLQSFYREG